MLSLFLFVALVMIVFVCISVRIIELSCHVMFCILCTWGGFQFMLLVVIGDGAFLPQFQLITWAA